MSGSITDMDKIFYLKLSMKTEEKNLLKMICILSYTDQDMMYLRNILILVLVIKIIESLVVK